MSEKGGKVSFLLLLLSMQSANYGESRRWSTNTQCFLCLYVYPNSTTRRHASSVGDFHPSVLSDSSGEYIEITCGGLAGKLYLGMLRDYRGKHAGFVKHNGKYVTPGEHKAGKSKPKNWKKSIQYKCKPLQSVLPTIRIDKYCPQ